MADQRICKFCLAIAILIIAALAGFYLQRKSPPPPEPVAIEDGQTTDFSTGQAIVTETEEDQAALAKAQREMEEATAEVTFQPKPQP